MKQFVAKFEKLKQKFQATFSKPLSQSTAVTIIVLLSWLWYQLYLKETVYYINLPWLVAVWL